MDSYFNANLQRWIRTSSNINFRHGFLVQIILRNFRCGIVFETLTSSVDSCRFFYVRVFDFLLSYFDSFFLCEILLVSLDWRHIMRHYPYLNMGFSLFVLILSPLSCIPRGPFFPFLPLCTVLICSLKAFLSPNAMLQSHLK